MSEKDEMLREAGEGLGKFYVYLQQLQRSPSSSDRLPSADELDASLKAWREKGIKDKDLLFSYDLNSHPKAKVNQLPFSEMSAVAEAYRPLYVRYKVEYDLRQAASIMMRIREGYVKPDDGMVTTKLISEFEAAGDPAACKANLAAARKLDKNMKIGDKNLTLEQFQSEVCDALASVVMPWVTAARAALRERNKKAIAPFIAAGISGRKLDLMLEYADVYWRLPGGTRTDDPKKLAKSNVLFQWLEAQDRDDPRYTLNTIRRYQFQKDDLVKVTEKLVRRPVGASLDDIFE